MTTENFSVSFSTYVFFLVHPSNGPFVLMEKFIFSNISVFGYNLVSPMWLL